MIQALLFKFGLSKLLKYKLPTLLLATMLGTATCTRSHYVEKLDEQAQEHLLYIAEINKQSAIAQLEVERFGKKSGEIILNQLDAKLAAISKNGQQIIRETRYETINPECNINDDFAGVLNSKIQAGNSNSDPVPAATGSLGGQATGITPAKASEESRPEISQQAHMLHSIDLAETCGAIRQRYIALIEWLKVNHENLNPEEIESKND